MADRAEAEALENLIRINCAIAAGSAAKTAKVSRSDRPSSSDFAAAACAVSAWGSSSQRRAASAFLRFAIGSFPTRTLTLPSFIRGSERVPQQLMRTRYPLASSLPARCATTPKRSDPKHAGLRQVLIGQPPTLLSLHRPSINSFPSSRCGRTSDLMISCSTSAHREMHNRRPALLLRRQTFGGGGGRSSVEQGDAPPGTQEATCIVEISHDYVAF